MSGATSPVLHADRLALAIVERGPSSGSDLALVLGVRKETVLRVLRTSSRFERVGSGKSSAWRLAGTEREPLPGDRSADCDQGVAAALAALERRLAGVEAWLGLAGDPGPEKSIAGQIIVEEAAAAN